MDYPERYEPFESKDFYKEFYNSCLQNYKIEPPELPKGYTVTSYSDDLVIKKTFPYHPILKSIILLAIVFHFVLSMLISPSVLVSAMIISVIILLLCFFALAIANVTKNFVMERSQVYILLILYLLTFSIMFFVGVRQPLKENFILLLITLLPVISLYYLILAYCFNTTLIVVNPSLLSVRTSPIPIVINRKVPSDSVVRVLFFHKTNGRRGIYYSTYQIVLSLDSGQDVVFMNFGTKGEAMALKILIENHLKIEPWIDKSSSK